MGFDHFDEIVSSILSKTLAATRAGSAATRAGSAASFAIHNRFLHAAHYGSGTASGGTGSSRSHPIFELLNISMITGAVGLMWYEFYWNPPPLHHFTDDIVLYQCELHLTCHKVRVLLDYHDIPYKVVEANAFTMKGWSDFKGCPILILDGEQLNGAPAIFDRVAQKILSKQKEDSIEETKWLEWDDYYLYRVLVCNISRTASETFEYADHHLSNVSFGEKIMMKYSYAAILHLASMHVEQVFNITDERAVLYEAAETWVDALNGREFLGGSKPNLADLAVFGYLKGIRYVKSGKDMMEHTRIGEWYTRMENAVGKSSRIEV